MSFMAMHYYFLKKFKIEEKTSEKLNCSYSMVKYKSLIIKKILLIVISNYNKGCHLRIIDRLLPDI